MEFEVSFLVEGWRRRNQNECFTLILVSCYYFAKTIPRITAWPYLNTLFPERGRSKNILRVYMILNS